MTLEWSFRVKRGKASGRWSGTYSLSLSWEVICFVWDLPLCLIYALLCLTQSKDNIVPCCLGRQEIGEVSSIIVWRQSLVSEGSISASWGRSWGWASWGKQVWRSGNTSGTSETGEQTIGTLDTSLDSGTGVSGNMKYEIFS